MSTSTSRGGRRRRILHDGATALAVVDEESGESPIGSISAKGRRFAPPEGSVSFCITRRLLPRRLGMVSLTGAAGLAAAGVAVALCVGGPAISKALGLPAIAALDVSGTSIAHWMMSTLAAATAAMCLLIYGLRRHRMDDFKGLYRWWGVAGAAAMAVSLDSATALHADWAAALSAATGWAPLGGAIWWIIPSAIGLAAFSALAFVELRAPKAAGVWATAGVVCAVAALLVHLGVGGAAIGVNAAIIAMAVILLGQLSVLMSLLVYARHIGLEADGLVGVTIDKVAEDSDASTAVSKPRKRRTQRTESEEGQTPKETKVVRDLSPPGEPEVPSLKFQQNTQHVEWTDGSDGPEVDDLDGDPRSKKMTKAERKRLRREKATRHAA